MRFLLKIVLAPAIALLAVLIWLCGLTLKLSAWVFGIIGTVLGILGLAILLLDSVTNGIIVLVIAFLASPLGLPMLAAWMIGQMQRFRYFVQDAIYPPSTSTVCPVTKSDALLARKIAVPTMSSGSAILPRGIISSIAFFNTGSFFKCGTISVYVAVGASAFTLIPYFAHSYASTFTS